MSINHDHLHRVVTEMEQGVAATTKYTWLDLAREVLRMREQIKGLILAMETKAANNEWQDPAIIAGYLKEIVLGETNE